VQLGRPGVGQADQLLAPVLAGADGDPAGVDQGAQVAGERCPSGRRVKSDASDARLGSWTAGVDRFSVSLGE